MLCVGGGGGGRGGGGGGGRGGGGLLIVEQVCMLSMELCMMYYSSRSNMDVVGSLSH